MVRETSSPFDPTSWQFVSIPWHHHHHHHHHHLHHEEEEEEDEGEKEEEEEEEEEAHCGWAIPYESHIRSIVGTFEYSN